MENNWCCYIIRNKRCTYIGSTNNETRRLRQHNCEITGGAKYTRSRGAGWTHVCLIKGFKEHNDVLKFEWALKHVSKSHGIDNKIKNLSILLNKQFWTKSSPDSTNYELEIQWIDDTCRPTEFLIPSWITEKFNQSDDIK